MTNIYWPVFKNLESEIVRLTYSVHIDDNQLGVYSSLISDLILRASADIESISKELYKSNGGPQTQKLKYDTALDHLNGLWKLDKKVVVVSSISCYQTSRVIVPFAQNETSTFHGRPTYSWNNSYQNLKHDRANSLNFGSIKYLFDIMAALYVLNIYFKSESYELKRDNKATSFPSNLGSELFSIKVHAWSGHDGHYVYRKNSDFDECLYFVTYTDLSIEQVKKANQDFNRQQLEHSIKHPKFLEYLKNNDIRDYKGNNLMFDVLGQDEYLKMLRGVNIQALGDTFSKAEYMAAINKNNA